MTKSKVFVLFAVLAIGTVVITTPALAAPPAGGAKQIIMYDGYVQNVPDGQGQGGTTGAVLADTLIVVSNPWPLKAALAWLEVYDKYGTLVWEGTLLNGGNPLQDNKIPQLGYGWITLGTILAPPAAGLPTSVNRATHDPWGFEGRAEKFGIRIYSGLKKIPQIVEIKQIVYKAEEPYPAEACWNSSAIHSWTETSLGGLRGNGTVKIPVDSATGDAIWP